MYNKDIENTGVVSDSDMPPTKKVKIKELTTDPQAAIELFYKMLKTFPFKHESIRNTELRDVNTRFNDSMRMNSFWYNGIIQCLDNHGFRSPFEIREIDYRDIIYDQLKPRFTPFSYSNDLARSFFNNGLAKIPREANELGEIEINRAFRFISIILEELFHKISLKDNQGGWNGEESEFTEYFGIWLGGNVSEIILKTNDFLSRMNEILKLYFGKQLISLGEDGILRYIEASEESEQTRLSIRYLAKRGLKSVIDELDKYHHALRKGDKPECMWHCRKGTENLFKDILHKHKISDWQMGTDKSNKPIIKQVKDMELSDLKKVIKDNIENLFQFPTYSKNMKEGVDHLIQSSCDYIGGMTNNLVHGKGTTELQVSGKKIDPTDNEVNAVYSYLISLINTLLPFEKS